MSNVLGYLLATTFVGVAGAAGLEVLGQRVEAMYAAINAALQAAGAGG